MYAIRSYYVKFNIDDLGTTDNKSTYVTYIRIKPYSTNTADWTDHIV